MYQLKEAAVEQKQGQPWKVEKVCDDFNTADLARKNILVNNRDGIEAKVKFLPSVNAIFVSPSQHPPALSPSTMYNSEIAGSFS